MQERDSIVACWWLVSWSIKTFDARFSSAWFMAVTELKFLLASAKRRSMEIISSFYQNSTMLWGAMDGESTRSLQFIFSARTPCRFARHCGGRRKIYNVRYDSSIHAKSDALPAQPNSRCLTSSITQASSSPQNVLLHEQPLMLIQQAIKEFSLRRAASTGSEQASKHARSKLTRAFYLLIIMKYFHS